jgi:competence protein ComEC
MRRLIIVTGWVIIPLLIWWRTVQVNYDLNRLRAQTVGQFFDHDLATVIALDSRADKVFVSVQLSNGARLRVTASPYFTARPGDRYFYSGTPTWPAQPKPGEFDYGRWLIRQSFSGLGRGGLSSAREPPDQHLWLARRLSTWRHTIITQIRRLLPEPEASFLAGLLIGSRTDLPASVTEQLRRTGTSHVIAVSGANVVIVGVSVLWLARFILYRPRPAFWLTQTTIWLFVLLTGASAAAVRGGLAASVMITTSHHGRAPPSGTLLFLTAGSMLFVNPFVYIDVGWQLSMAAFAGLLYFGPPLSESRSLQRLPPLLRGPAAETTAASLATMPVSMASFGTFSLTGLIANPLILWLIPVATFMGLGGLIVAALLPGLWLPARLAAWLPLHVILTFVKWLSPLPLTWQL